MESIQPDSSAKADKNGSLCSFTEQPTGRFRVLAVSAWMSGGRRMQYGLLMNVGLPFPAHCSHPEMSDEDQRGQGRFDNDHAVLATSDLVSAVTRALVRNFSDPAGPSTSLHESHWQLLSPNRDNLSGSCRMKVVRRRYKDLGLSDETVGLLLGSTREFESNA